MYELLSVRQMGAADRWAIESGTAGIELMENAGRAVFRAVLRLAPADRPILVAAGPGNNGGDGFIVARVLAAHGFAVKLGMAGSPDRLTGDAAIAFQRWSGPWNNLADCNPDAFGLIVDALLGAGLDRLVEGEIGRFIECLNMSGRPVVSVDLPSGIHGDTGQVMGRAVTAAATVTFFRCKPGHLLLPGRSHCGEIHIEDIGIPVSALKQLGIILYENTPANWRWTLPKLDPAGHKYSRGHAIVVSGAMHSTGAARLAAEGALRVGAGLVTLASPPDALVVNAAHLTEIMLKRMEDTQSLATLLCDERVSSVALGPALGMGPQSRGLVAEALASGRAVVLDADALTGFASDPQTLFSQIAAAAGPVILTPHEGEFRRLFDGLERDGGKVETAIEAARESDAVVIFKGADTVVAAPDGRAVINASAPPWLATAGSGDVLTGLVCGLAAQGMPGFEAACAAVWIHGAAAARFGPGMTAGDVVESIPAVLSTLHQT